MLCSRRWGRSGTATRCGCWSPAVPRLRPSRRWYATLFSGFYLPLLLILVALILRGVAFEYRSKRSDPTWRKRWDAAIVVGSFVPALLWGVAFANIVRGVPMRLGEQGNSLYDGGFFNLLNPYALVGGLTTLTLFMTHGAIFLALKTDGEIRVRANKLAGQIGLVATVIAVIFLLWTQLAYSDKAWTWALVVVAALCWLAGLAMNRAGRGGLVVPVQRHHTGRSGGVPVLGSVSQRDACVQRSGAVIDDLEREQL